MKNEEFKKITDNMQEKIGKENAAKIADDFAKIISDNLQTNKLLDDKDSKIKTLEKDKEDLMLTNMNLLQQIPMGKEEPKGREEPKEPVKKASEFDYRSVFDENGNFKR